MLNVQIAKYRLQICQGKQGICYGQTRHLPRVNTSFTMGK